MMVGQKRAYEILPTGTTLIRINTLHFQELSNFVSINRLSQIIFFSLNIHLFLLCMFCLSVSLDPEKLSNELYHTICCADFVFNLNFLFIL